MSEVIRLNRDEVCALARNCKNEFEVIWNGFLNEVASRGKTCRRLSDYTDDMKRRLDRLLVIIDTESINRFDSNDDPSKTLNCPSVFITGEQNGKR